MAEEKRKEIEQLDNELEERKRQLTRSTALISSVATILGTGG